MAKLLPVLYSRDNPVMTLCNRVVRSLEISRWNDALMDTAPQKMIRFADREERGFKIKDAFE